MRDAPVAAAARPACPACARVGATEVFRVSAADAAQHFVLAEEDPSRHAALVAHIRTLWRGDGCRVVRCVGCGCRYADPFVAGDEAFYTLAYRRRGYPAVKWEFERAREFIAALPSPPSRLLEVGAGDGAFLATVSPSIVPREGVLATEFSDYGLAALRRAGFRVERLDFRALRAESCGGAFDVVCLFQVLEHLDDLDRAFRTLRDLCAPGGHLLLAVPSDRRIELAERNGALLDMPPNHVTLWTPGALAALGERQGFEVIEHAEEPGRSLPDAARFLEYRFRRAAQRPGSWANRIATVRGARLRWVLAALWAACTGPEALPALVRILTTPGGASQFVVLRRGRA